MASSASCSGSLGCKTIQLSGAAHPLDDTGTTPREALWNIIASPVSGSQPPVSVDDIRVTSQTGNCSVANQGCTLEQASNANLMFDVLFNLQPFNTRYRAITSGSLMRPWEGYWAAELLDAVDNEPTMNMPKN